MAARLDLRRVWVASTCSTSLVPMPNASAPNAPWVDVWLSPHTIVMPGWVRPSSGPITCTMPWLDAAQCVQRHAELGAVVAQPGHLLGGHRVGDRLVDADGRYVVVHCRQREIGPAYLSARQVESLERLRRGDLVHQVQVDIQEHGLAFGACHDMMIPDLVKQACRHLRLDPRGVSNYVVPTLALSHILR